MITTSRSQDNLLKTLLGQGLHVRKFQYSLHESQTMLKAKLDWFFGVPHTYSQTQTFELMPIKHFHKFPIQILPFVLRPFIENLLIGYPPNAIRFAQCEGNQRC